MLVEPDALDTVVLERAPAMVVCSRLTPEVEQAVPVWVLLYPSGERAAVVSIRQQRTSVADLELPGLLALIDQANSV